VPQGTVGADAKDVQVVRAPGYDSRFRCKGAADGSPTVPGTVSIPSGPDGVVFAQGIDVDLTRAPRSYRRFGDEAAAEANPNNIIIIIII
jgi:hypothetical protein